MMESLQIAALGGVAFLVGLFVVYKLLLAATPLGNDPSDEESTRDRMDVGGEDHHRRVGFRHRVSSQTPMTKAFLASVLVLLTYLAVAFYQVAATGTPAEAVYAEYLEIAVFGFVCVVGGVWFKAKQDAKAGELQITIENDDGVKRRTVKFDHRQQQPTSDGTLVPELKEYQVFGLFWRPKLIADDPKRRDADHRLPDDLVMWFVPDDDSAVWDERAGEVSVRASDIREVENVNRVADYEIVPSERKSKSEIQQLENEINEIEADYRAERVQNGILSEKLTEIEDILTNEEDAGLRKIRQAKEVLETDTDRRYEYDDRDREAGRGSDRPTPASSD